MKMAEDIKNQFNQSILHNPTFYGGGNPKPPHVLAPPTASVPDGFLGRTKELDDIRALLCQAGGQALALVNAEGGMGKTTLAAAYWQRYQADYKHCAWLFCETGILAALRRQLPEPLQVQDAMNTYADNPTQQVQVLKTHMANLEKDCLLVLDNANEPEHITGFLQEMNGLGWHVLLTSRCAKVLPDPKREYTIGSLPPDLAKQLFKNNYNHEQGPAFEALLDRFLAAVGYNTLCIEIFSKNLHEAAALGQNLADLLQQLEQNGLLLGENSFFVRADYAQNIRREAATSDQLVEALYDLGSLPPEESDLLLQCCLLPAESHLLTVLVALLDPDHPPALKRRLDRLAQKGWLGTDTSTYRASPMVQKIVLQKCATERRWAFGAPLVERLNALFETEGLHSKNIATAAPFAALVPELVANLGVANDDVVMLFDRLWIYHNATGNLAGAINAATQIKLICEKYDQKNGLAIAYSKLGETHTALGNLQQALTFFEQSTELMKELFDAFPQNVSFKNGLAISYEKLGDTHSALGNLQQALTFFDDETKLFEELFDAFPQNVDFKNGLAISYSKLGDTHSALGNLQQALTFFEERSRLGKELFDAFPQNVSFKNGLAISYSKLGDTHSALGNLQQALTFFEQYNNLREELFDAFPQNVEFKNGLALSYQWLGWFCENKLQDTGKAKENYQQSKLLLEALASTFPDYVQFKKNLDWVENALAGLDS